MVELIQSVIFMAHASKESKGNDSQKDFCHSTVIMIRLFMITEVIFMFSPLVLLRWLLTSLCKHQHNQQKIKRVH